MSVANLRSDLLCAWCGSSLLIVDIRGGCDHPLTGFYHRETRTLCDLELRLNGQPAWLCEAAAPDPRRLEFSYVYPEVALYGGGGSGQSGDDQLRDRDGLPQRGLLINVEYRVNPSSLVITAQVTNVSLEPLACELRWRMGADFADIQEAQGRSRRQQATVRRVEGPSKLTFTYEHPQLPLQSEVDLDAAPEWRFSSEGAATQVSLSPGGRTTITLHVHGSDERGRTDISDEADRGRAADAWRRQFTRITAPHIAFERSLAANVRDLASFPWLQGPPDEWLTLQAGIPLYPALFGRDAITAGWQMALVDCGQALQSALTTVGRRQSDRNDAWRDEEPGRIPYQMRDGPLARLGINPYSAYYADFASPLMFVIAPANLYAWRGRDDELQQHWDTARRILEWAERYGDADGDGYLEYFTRSSDGTKNQGWKDSGDAIVYEDGTPVPAPIATCELQGYWYAAQELMGLLQWMRGESRAATASFAAARDLKQRFNLDWWVPAEQSFALAMDPEKRAISAVSSNVGHCLASGIIDAEHMRLTVARLFAPDMFSGWGIRTLSSSHAYYDPVSYRRGTV